jgi:hypothetical protein
MTDEGRQRQMTESRSPRDGDLYEGRGSRPVPDPTELTSMLVDKAFSNLREILEAQIQGQKELFQARFAAIEQATQLHQDRFDRIPDQIDAKITSLARLGEERFKTIEEHHKTVEQQFLGIQTQFQERDVRVRESALAATTAINAALQSQKEAAGEQAKSFTLSIDKSEKGTLEQINQQRALLDAMKQGFDGKIDDVKERVTRIESIGAGRIAEVVDTRAAATDSRGNTTLVIYAALALLAVLTFLLAQRGI